MAVWYLTFARRWFLNILRSTIRGGGVSIQIQVLIYTRQCKHLWWNVEAGFNGTFDPQSLICVEFVSNKKQKLYSLFKLISDPSWTDSYVRTRLAINLILMEGKLSVMEGNTALTRIFVIYCRYLRYVYLA